MKEYLFNFSACITNRESKESSTHQFHFVAKDRYEALNMAYSITYKKYDACEHYFEFSEPTAVTQSLIDEIRQRC